MEDNFIYDDLVSQGDLGEVIHNLQNRNNDLELHVASLEEDVKKLCDKITEMKSVQDNLSRNISELFKTAKMELSRKDRRIAELQAQLDDIVFRRNPAQSHGAFKRKRDEQNWEETNKKTKSEVVVVDLTNTVTDKVIHKDDKRTNERGKSESNSNDFSRHGSDRGGKTSQPRENTKNERIPQKVEDSRTSVLDSIYPDNNSQHKYDHSGKTSYSREINNRRDRKDDQRDGNRDRRSNTDSRTDRRDRVSRRDHRDDKEHFSGGHRDNNRGHRDRSRDYRNIRKDFREPHREHKDHRRENRNTRLDDTKRTSDVYRNEPKETHHPRNDKIDDFNYFGDEPVDSDPRGRPVFSAAESLQSPSECCWDKEEGEVSEDDVTHRDNRVEDPTMQKLKTQCVNSKGMDVRNVDENKGLKNELYNKIGSKSNFMDNRKSKPETVTNPRNHKEQSRLKSGIYTKNDPPKNVGVIQESNKVHTKNITEKCGESKDQEMKQLPKENVALKKEETGCDLDKDNGHINIISQVILNQGVEVAAASSSKTKPTEQSASQESKDKSSILVPKLDRPRRESRVPRNLTDELNINLDRSVKKQNLMTQLFGSSEKKESPQRFDQFSPSSINLSHDGEIPKLDDLSCSEAKEILNEPNTNSTNSSNPVTEFQIFKTNLPSLEKSNSLPSIEVQIQTPDYSTKNKEQKQSLEKTITEDNIQEAAKLKALSVSKDCPVSTQAIENVSHCNDVCDVSFDLLNMDIGQCRAEDFPNLIAHSELRNMSDLLLTPKESIVKNVPKTKHITRPNVKNLTKETKLEKKESNQEKEPVNHNELSGHNMNEKEVQLNIKSSDVNIKDKMQSGINEVVIHKDEVVSKLPKTDKKKNKINTDTKITDIVNTGKIPNASQELNSEKSLQLETSKTTERTESLDIPSNVKNSTKKSTTSKSQRQNKANINKKTKDGSSPCSSENPTTTSNLIANTNMEPPANANGSKETKNTNVIDRRRKRCAVKWV